MPTAQLPPPLRVRTSSAPAAGRTPVTVGTSVTDVASVTLAGIFVATMGTGLGATCSAGAVGAECATAAQRTATAVTENGTRTGVFDEDAMQQR